MRYSIAKMWGFHHHATGEPIPDEWREAAPETVMLD